MKISQIFIFLILLFAGFLAEAQTHVQFTFANSQFVNSQYTNSLVRLQGYSYNANGTMTILGSPIWQYTDTNASTTFSNLSGSYTGGFYQWKVMPFSQQPGLLNPPDVPENSGWIQVTSTNLGLISSTLCGVTGVPTWGGTGAAYNTQTSDQRYSPSTTSLSNFVQIGQLLSTSNSIVAQIPSTNGFVTAAITNGLASLPALTNYAYPLSNPSNFIPPSATNGFVNSTITNGLASLVAVTNQIQSATNQLASTNYVNGQGFVTSAVTNGLATTNQLAVYTLTNNFILGTNAVATNAYAQLIATNNALVSALAIQNSNLLASLAVSSNLLASTKQPASMTLSNLALTGAFTNFLAAGTNVLISTNISGNTLYINATNQTFLTNGMTSLAFTNPASVLYTSALPALTNGFVTSGITNGLASQSYVSNAVATSGAFTNFLAAGTNVVFSTNFSGNTIYINATNQTFLTNGFSSLVFSNPAVVLYTNALPALTNGFVAASITNGFIGAAYVSNALIASNYFNQYIVAGTNVLITSNMSGNTIYINATNQSFLTNGLVTAAITNGLLGASATNGLATTGYVASALSPYALTSSLTAATNTLWTNSVANFYPLANPSNYVNQTALNGTNSALLADIAATNTASLIITTNLVVASTNGGNIVFTNNSQFVNAITNPALFVASTNGNAFGLSISNYAGFWTKTNFLCTTNVIGIVGNDGGTYLWNGSTIWTNPFQTNLSILLSAGNYYLQSNSVSLYQSTNIINWTVVVGAAPAPVGSWGSKWGMDGVQVVGWLSSTNLYWQITNQAMILINKYAVNPTNGTTPSVVTNIANYLIGVSNVGSVYTNGNTGVGQVVYSTNVAPGYVWGAAPSGGGTAGWNTNGNNVIAGSFLGSTNSQNVVFKMNGTQMGLLTTNYSIINGYSSIETNAYVQNQYNVICGGNANAAGDTVFNSFGSDEFIGGGRLNVVSGQYGVIVGGSQNINYPSGSSIVGGGNNVIAIGATYSFIGGGVSNTNESQAYESIVCGLDNFAHGQYAGILSGRQNQIGILGGNGSSYSSVIDGILNTIGDGSTASWIGVSQDSAIGTNALNDFIPFGQNNTISNNVANSIAIGSSITISSNNCLVANDTTAVSTTTNNQAVLYFTNGICINTNSSGTNILEVAGNVDSTVGFSIKGIPVQQIYWISNQTAILPKAIIPAICYTLLGGQFIKTNSTLDTNGWYQNIADHP